MKKYQVLGLALGFVLGLIFLGGIIEMTRDRHTQLAYREGGIKIPWISETIKYHEKEIDKQAKSYDIDPDLIAIIMTLESGGHTKAFSGVAKGLMQVTDPTAGDIASKFLHSPVNEFDLYDAKTSIEFGVAYLVHLRVSLCGDDRKLNDYECVEAIAAGYNGGPGAALSLLNGQGLKATETIIYSRNAYNLWRERVADKSPTYERWLEAGGRDLITAAKIEQSKR